MKNIYTALAAALMTTASIADISLSGEYTGTLNDSGVYTQDIETTLKGISGDSTVTLVLDEALDVDDLYVESTLGALTFKLGDYSGDDPDATKLNVTTVIGPITVGATQTSGGATTFDAGGTFAGVTVNSTDITNVARKTTASYDVSGLSLDIVHQKVGDDHQIQSDVSSVVGAVEGIGGITVSVDRNQNADNDAFEDGSWGGSASAAIGGLGTVEVSGHKTSADVKSYGLSVTQGIFTGSWDKTGDADGVLSLKAVVSF
jgi:hypothetical protein